jgi:hypothetical protein
MVYEETRGVLKVFQYIIRDSVTYTEIARRRMWQNVTEADVLGIGNRVPDNILRNLQNSTGLLVHYIRYTLTLTPPRRVNLRISTLHVP